VIVLAADAAGFSGVSLTAPEVSVRCAAGTAGELPLASAGASSGAERLGDATAGVFGDAASLVSVALRSSKTTNTAHTASAAARESFLLRLIGPAPRERASLRQP
jgi:hypothetical protein